MAVFRCKMCGGDLEISSDMSVAVCEYCGTKQTVPSADNEKKLMMFERANKLRSQCEFDKAAGMYESIVTEFPYESEAYWGIILCKYGIEYVDDPTTGQKIPTCHRSSFDSVLEDECFEKALSYADVAAVSVYREEAKSIENLRRSILEVSSKEAPYDIFICYKETDDTGNRTVDSVIAQDIYKALKEEGYRVFFSRITLEDKLGVAYEPYIFAALNSAKVMLAVGTNYDYYNAVWVKNEWSRFLQLIAKGEKKVLIPCYKDIGAYDMPKEFKHLQAQDMGKVGAIQDLLRGIGKIINPKNRVQNATDKMVSKAASAEYNRVEALLKRAYMFASDRDFINANKYFEMVLDTNPENGDAYLGKFLCDYKVTKLEELRNLSKDIRINLNYSKVMHYGSDNEKEFIESVARNTSYNYGLELQRKDTIESLQVAVDNFRFVDGLYDARDRVKQCEDRIRCHQEFKKNREYRNKLAAQRNTLVNQKNGLKYNTDERNTCLLSFLGFLIVGIVILLLYSWLSKTFIFGGLVKALSFFIFVFAGAFFISAIVFLVKAALAIGKESKVKAKQKIIIKQIADLDAEIARLPKM